MSEKTVPETDRQKERFAVDTSVIVAGLLSWHEHHDLAREWLETILEEHQLVLPTRVLVESYSVLTRLPPPHRLSPRDAFDLLAGSFREQAQMIDFEADGRWVFLEEGAAQHLQGGATYDAEIIHTAVDARARKLVTLNRRHFDRFAPPSLEILGI